MSDSPSKTNSCLSLANPYFTLPGVVSQCEEFKVSYTGSKAPSIHLLQPGEGSETSGLVSDNPTARVATYIMSQLRGKEIIIYAYDEDGLESGQASSLLTGKYPLALASM